MREREEREILASTIRAQCIGVTNETAQAKGGREWRLRTSTTQSLIPKYIFVFG